jgi:pyruvate dehydrogenase E2 component (dihydrolipoyllysine-residue acetyltransferase)
MAEEVIMPALGMAQETGTILRWLKAAGDTVARGEPLMEIQTDKATVEVESPADGLLADVRTGEGEEVPVGHVVALVLAPGEQLPAAPAAAAPAPAAPAPAPAAPAPAAAPATEAPAGRRLASPKARRMAAELGLEVAELAGSGPNGAVVAADVERAVAAPRAAPATAGGGVWRIMAEHTARSWREAPHFFLHRRVDASRLISWRAAVLARADGERVSHTDLLVRVVAEALCRHPDVNARWADGGPARQPAVNVGVAVATDEALVVPVIHGADRLELAQITARRTEMTAAARAGRLRPADLDGGTFTISNLGMYGVDSFDAIVNGPEAAILAVGRIADRVVALDGAAVVRPTIELSVSFDHRVVDGARGAAFLGTLAALVEEPAGLVR